MKKKILGIFALVLLVIGISKAQQTYSPFVKTSTQDKSIVQLSNEIIAGLESKNFKVIGQYHPMQSDDLLVICFTRDDLQKASLSFSDRGALASVLKIGLIKETAGVNVSIQNPMYMFYAYFRNDIKQQMAVLEQIDKDAKGTLSELYGNLSPFGGSLDVDKLMKYHYKVMMPYFDDPVELETYASFEEGLAHIQSKLTSSLTVVKVFEQIHSEKQVAVFGLAFNDAEEGEAKYLPIIGQSHLAALPYEIILQDKEVSMLHGKYRIALYWPELTMGTFMKIMSTPGDIKGAFSTITEK